jgi:hypothetical protein
VAVGLCVGVGVGGLHRTESAADAKANAKADANVSERSSR